MEWEGRQQVCTFGKSMCGWRGEYIYMYVQKILNPYLQ